MASLGTAYIKIAPDLTGVQSKISRGMSSAGTNASSQFDKSYTSGVVSSLATVGKRIVQVGSIAATVTAGMILKGGFTRALNIEDAQAKLKGLGHDVASVKSIMDSALKSVKGTAYTLDEAATTAATAVAAGIKPGKELTKYLSLTADAANIAGYSMADMGRVFNKVQTVNAAYNDSLLELSEKGIPIYQWLSKELGVSAEAVKELASEGKISSEQFRKAVEKNIGGAALSSGKTTRGSFKNMLAGFSRVGEQLVSKVVPKIRGGLQDITEWSDRIGKLVPGAVEVVATKLSELAKTAEEVGKQVGDYLGPKFKALFNTLKDDLYPILKDLWENVLKPLIPVIGTALVVSLGLAVDALNIIITSFSWLYEAIKNGNPIIWGLIGLFGTLAASMAFNAVFNALSVGFATLRLVTIPNTIASIGVLRGAILAPMVMPAIAVAAAIAALVLVRNAANEARKAVEGASSAARNASDSNAAVIGRLRDLAKSGSADQKARAKKTLKQLADSGSFASGGFTGTGAINEIAGVVHKGEYVLPKSQVNQNTGLPKQELVNGQYKNVPNIYQTNTIYTELDMNKINRNLTWELARA